MIPAVPRLTTRPSLALAGCALLAAAAAAPTVEVSRAPGKPWVAMPTRRLADLPPLPADPPGSRFGGTPTRTATPTGFFHTTRVDGRWWLVDPDGHLFIHRGVASVRQVKSPAADRQLERQFGGTRQWAAATATLLHDHGFNGLGAWSDDATLRPAESQLVYTKLWNFMSAYGKQRGGTFQKPGHTGYPGDCPFIFDPEFPAFCDQHARQLAATKDDPWLLGHFTDNELPWSAKLLANYLALPATDPGHRAAADWLRRRHGPAASRRNLTDTDRQEFLAHAADTYFGIVAAAIRRHDPHHLVLGSRFHGGALREPALFRAAGRHLDVVSVNYYHAWTPDPRQLAGWTAAAAKPVIITEWYAKALDSGLANSSGAGWLVRTQADRAAFYQNFTLALLESRNCVGWHWFRYADNDPAERADASNLDSNKGIVSNRYTPYQPLLDAMREVNLRTAGIIRHFDRVHASHR